MRAIVFFAFAMLALALVVRGDGTWPATDDVEEATQAAIAKYKRVQYRHKYSEKKHDDDDDEGYYKHEKEEYYASDDDGDYKASCHANNKDVTASGPSPTYCPPNKPDSPCTVPQKCPDLTCTTPGCNPACVPQTWKRYDAEQVRQHFAGQPNFAMADDRHHSFSCVDARGAEPMLGTPGGDLAEMMAASMALIKIKAEKEKKDKVTNTFVRHTVHEVFEAFIEHVITRERPLYMHTDDSRLRRLFVYLGDAARLGVQPVELPYVGPKGNKGDIWIEGLTKPDYNGCGHIRLMLSADVAKYFSVLVPGEDIKDCSAAGVDIDQCIDSKVVATKMIEEFFNYWWFTKPGSEPRHKTMFHVDGILGGPLLGTAVAIVKNKPAGACPHQAPLVRPNFGASQVFVYTPDAVADWRTYAAHKIASIIPEGEMDEFIKYWNAIAGQQLGATLNYLPPANNVGLFTVEVPVAEYGAHSH